MARENAYSSIHTAGRNRSPPLNESTHFLKSNGTRTTKTFAITRRTNAATTRNLARFAPVPAGHR